MRARHIERHRVVFRDDAEKLAFMRERARRGGTDPHVVKLVTRLVRSYRPDDYIGQVREIHRWVRDGIRYQHDPGRVEQLADPVATILRGQEDCDGKAMLAVALARAIGIEADVHPVWKGPVLAHVQARYRFPGSSKVEGADGEGWLLGEVTIRGAEPGDDPLTFARNPITGRLPLV